MKLFFMLLGLVLSSALFATDVEFDLDGQIVITKIRTGNTWLELNDKTVVFDQSTQRFEYNASKLCLQQFSNNVCLNRTEIASQHTCTDCREVCNRTFCQWICKKCDDGTIVPVDPPGDF